MLFFSFSALSAQELYFCKSYTEEGQPIDADIQFDIDAFGNSVYLLFDNEGNRIGDDLLYMFIDKDINNNFEPFDSKVLRIDSRDTWAVVDYMFKEQGKYLVYFMNSDQKKLVEETVTIKLKEDVPGQRRVYQSSYYDNCELVFCERVIADKPVNIKKSYPLSQNNGEIFIFINNNRPLNSGKLLLDIWRKKNRAFEYDEFIASKKYKINPDWNDAFFKYIFTEKGEYKFSVYNENEIPLGTLYIRIY